MVSPAGRLVPALGYNLAENYFVQTGQSRTPAHEVLVYVSWGALTAHGGLDATFKTLARDPSMIAYKARDARKVLWAGRRDGGDVWLRNSPNPAERVEMSVEQIEGEWGQELRGASGIRKHPDFASPYRGVSFGGRLPDYLDENVLMDIMGLDHIRGTDFGNQRRFLLKANMQAMALLYSAFEALAALPQPLSHYSMARDVGSFFAAAYDGYDMVADLYEKAKRLHERRFLGEPPVEQPEPPENLLESHRLAYLLSNMWMAVLDNLLGPPADFKRQSPREIIQRIVGKAFDINEGADTMGPADTGTNACASGTSTVHKARKYLKTDAGEWPMRLVFLGSACSALLPRKFPISMTGFGSAAVSDAALDRTGYTPDEISRPFQDDAEGMVCSDGSAFAAGMPLSMAIAYGLPYEKCIGSSMRAGQGGKAHESGVNHGMLNCVAEVLRQAGMTHGIGVERFEVAGLHGTSTRASNISDTVTVALPFHALGFKEQLAVLATKGPLGHAQAAASMIDLALGLEISRTGIVPGLYNFREGHVDPRIGDPEKNGVDWMNPMDLLSFRGEPRPYRGGAKIRNSAGFGSINGAEASIPGDPDRDMEFYPGIPQEHRDSYWSRRRDNEAAMAARRETYLRAEKSGFQVAMELAYR